VQRGMGGEKWRCNKYRTQKTNAPYYTQGLTNRQEKREENGPRGRAQQ